MKLKILILTSVFLIVQSGKEDKENKHSSHRHQPYATRELSRAEQLKRLAEEGRRLMEEGRAGNDSLAKAFVQRIKGEASAREVIDANASKIGFMPIKEEPQD